MKLETILLMSLGLNLFTLIVSYYTLRRYKKIVKLSNLIYDKLSFSQSVSKGLEEDFKQSLHKHLKIDEFSEVATQQPEQTAQEADPLMELKETDFPFESPTRVMTKAESHLVKVLQAKYSINDHEDPHPAGN